MSDCDIAGLYMYDIHLLQHSFNLPSFTAHFGVPDLFAVGSKTLPLLAGTPCHCWCSLLGPAVLLRYRWQLHMVKAAAFVVFYLCRCSKNVTTGQPHDP